jgi:alpha-tubulin suppressor-like RCC1 family protein
LFGDMQDRPTPTAIRGITGASALAVGRQHACAVIRDGGVTCWGDDSRGQLGDGGERRAKSVAPQKVTRISGATAIAAGGDTSCAIVDGGKVACWGYNDVGQGGADRDARIQFPRPVEGIDGATDLAMGRRHACARVAGGEVRCWGYVGDDALGAGAPRDVRDVVEVKLVK